MRSALSLLSVLACVLFCSQLSIAQTGEPTILHYESFDDGKADGPVGKAGSLRNLEARGLVNMDRGTLSLFVYSDKAPNIREWDRMVGMNGPRGGGYWGMIGGFTRRLEDFNFDLFDVGRYSPPMMLEPSLTRWKAGEWHHLAAVWDRNEGFSVYEDGKKVNTNWGEYTWNWNLLPTTFFARGTVDELYLFAEPLTDAQIAQLAKGEKPAGSPISTTSESKRRDNDLARMGWSGDSLDVIPRVAPDKPIQIDFARITGAVDSKRPVAQMFEGFYYTTWPMDMYGASTKGNRLDLTLEKGSSFDHARFFTQRRFRGELRRPTLDGQGETLVNINTPAAQIWHCKLDAVAKDQQLYLTRETGMLGQIDFYSTSALKAQSKPADIRTFHFEAVDSLPEDETGLSLKGETPHRFWNPLGGTTNAPDAATINSPAFGGWQAVTEPVNESHAFDGAVITLVAEGVNKPTPVRVKIKEPIYGLRDWLIADVVLEPKGKGKQSWTVKVAGRPIINMPQVEQRKYLGNNRYSDEINVVPGMPFGFSVEAANPVTWHIGKGGTTVSIVKTSMEKALPAATDDQVEFMREAYAELMEGHAYRDDRLVYPMKWLVKFAPERMEVRQMYERIGSPKWFEGINVPVLVYTPPKNDSGAPDWAFYQQVVMNDHRDMIHWRIDNWQLPNGEIGGVWNDDTIHMENWIGMALSIDESGKIKDSIRKLADGNWNHLDHGAGRYVQDACHYYEEGMGIQAMRMLIDYGDPEATTRAMLAASHLEDWMVKVDGKWVGRGEWFSQHTIWDKQGFDDPGLRGHRKDVLVPSGYVIWYNRHPMATKWYASHDEFEGGYFHAAAMHHALGVKKFYDKFREGLTTPPGRRSEKSFFYYASHLPIQDDARNAMAEKVGEFADPGPIADYWGALDTEQHYYKWFVTRDDRWLVASYQRASQWFATRDWLNNYAQPSRDRCPVPRIALVRSRLGGLAANRGSSGLGWPDHAISYEKRGDDVSALITENKPTKIEGRFYAFADKPHDMQLRTWRLQPGSYKVTLMKDANDDGKGEGVISEQTVDLQRGAYLDVQLPPKETVVLSIEAIKSSPMNYDRADPAVGPMSAEYVYKEHLVVKVYNLGSKPAENVRVVVRDGRSGRKVFDGDQTIERIEASSDLHPVYNAVEFKNINAHTYGSIIIEVDPDGEIDDLNPYNNRYELEL